MDAWIIHLWRHSHQTSGGLWWNVSDIRAEVFHPACKEVRFGFAISCEITISTKEGCNDRYYGGQTFSRDKFLSEVLPAIKHEVVMRALADAKKNFKDLTGAIGFESYVVRE